MSYAFRICNLYTCDFTGDRIDAVITGTDYVLHLVFNGSYMVLNLTVIDVFSNAINNYSIKLYDFVIF